MIHSDAEAAALLERRAHQIAAAAAARLLEQNDAMQSRYGPDAVELWTQHFRQRVLELCAALEAGEPEVFATRVAWSRTAMAAREVLPADLKASLATLRSGIELALTGGAQRAALECIDQARAALNREPAAADASTLDPGLEVDRLAQRFIQAVVAGNVLPGMQIIIDAVDEGLGVRDAILNVLLPAQREVGHLWHLNEISVAEEHMVTSTTQRLMAVLANRAIREPDRGRTAVTAAVAGNAHEIGIRAISYLLESEGWRTIYLGADVPRIEIPAAVETFAADIVLLSLALSTQLPALKRALTAIRSIGGIDVKIMIGGNGLADAPDLWRELGADGYAPDALGALVLADELVPLSRSG